VLEGEEMARGFAWMRPNELVWNYWVNNYLLGNAPPAFDVLAWNADTARLPAGFHGDLLTIIESNAYMRPGRFTIRDTPLDVSRIDCDVFWLAGTTDHIAPWPACYRSTHMIGGRCEFVLGAGGHIQSILSAPGTHNAGFFTNPERPQDPEEWLATATEHEGDWWRHWRTWILRRSGPMQDAPTEMGTDRHPPLIAAPGTYVYET
jgi:polyhydroxyalkanoate synthase